MVLFPLNYIVLQEIEKKTHKNFLITAIYTTELDYKSLFFPPLMRKHWGVYLKQGPTNRKGLCTLDQVYFSY